MRGLIAKTAQRDAVGFLRQSLAKAAVAFIISATPAVAGDPGNIIANSPPPAPPPAPFGVFGADMPAAGRFTLSVAPDFVGRAGSRIGTQGVSSEYVVTTTPWFVYPKLKLRLVPQSTFFATQTVGLAYGVTNDLAVFVTTGMIEKNLDMLTFKGPSGLTRLGMSYTGTQSPTDTTLAAVYRIYQDDVHRVQVNLGLTFPTGGNQNTFTLLQPDGTYMTSRAFYAMQLGTGTYDVMPGVIYAGHLDKWSWGLGYRARLPLAANPQGYRWGDLHQFTGWFGYSWLPSITTTFRLAGTTQTPIRGTDWHIFGKAQAANPNYYGGQLVEAFGGAIIGGKLIGYESVSIAIEAGLPVYQSLNGPQISKNWQASMALRIKM